MTGLGVDFNIDNNNKTIEITFSLGQTQDTLKDLIELLQDNNDILDYKIVSIDIEK